MKPAPFHSVLLSYGLLELSSSKTTKTSTAATATAAPIASQRLVPSNWLPFACAEDRAALATESFEALVWARAGDADKLSAAANPIKLRIINMLPYRPAHT